MTYDVIELNRFCNAAKSIKLLLPSELRQAIDNYKIGGACQAGLSVFDAFPRGDSVHARTLRANFPLFNEFEQSDFYQHITRLYAAGILIPKRPDESHYLHNVNNKALHKYVQNKDRAQLVNVLIFLKEHSEVLNEENKNQSLDSICAKNKNLEHMRLYFLSMHALGLLEGTTGIANFTVIMAHREPDLLIKICLFLSAKIGDENQPQVVRQAIFTATAKHAYLNGIRCSLYDQLNHASAHHFMTFRFLLGMLQSHEPESVFKALCELETKAMLSAPSIVDNITDVITSQNPEEVAKAAIYFFEHYQDNAPLAPNMRDYIQMIVKCPEPYDMAHALSVLVNEGMIDNPTVMGYFKGILNQPYRDYLRITAQGISDLSKQGILNQCHVNFIIGTCAISHSRLLIELHKAHFFEEKIEDAHLDMLEKHENPLSLTQAWILRVQYRKRFIEEDTMEISDVTLMECLYPAHQVQCIALKRILSQYPDSPEAKACIAEINEVQYIAWAHYPLLNMLFELDRKDQLSSTKIPQMLRSICSQSPIKITSSESSPDVNADPTSSTDQFFKLKWRLGSSIFESRNYARLEYQREVEEANTSRARMMTSIT